MAAGLVICTLVAEVRSRLPRSRYWNWWLLGTLLGLCSALPWARDLTLLASSGPKQPLYWFLLIRVFGYFYGIVAVSTNLLPFAFLGTGEDTNHFLTWPKVYGFATNGTEFLEVCFAGVIFARIVVWLFDLVFVQGVRWVRQIRSRIGGGQSSGGDNSPASMQGSSRSEWTATGFYLWSTLAIPSVIFMVMVNLFFYHYYFVLCPFLFVLVAAFMLPWRSILFGMVVAEALLSYSFLDYVHKNGGIAHGEYGVSYSRQGYR